jgi:hypothetical protein
MRMQIIHYAHSNLSVEHGLGLASETRLLTVVAALSCQWPQHQSARKRLHGEEETRTLGVQGGLAGLVLGDPVGRVLAALA